MHHVLKILKVPKRSHGIIWVGLVMALLTACGTVTPAPAANADERFDLITRVDIDPATSQAELEAASGGSIIVFRPEAGFAIVAFEKGQGDLALMSTADNNQDVFGTPEASASGWTAWSGGWTAWSGGWTAWSGGWTAWSGGWTAWSGGWTAWSGGVSSSSTLSENLLPWDQINLPQGQLRAPNLGNGIKVAVIDTGLDLNHPAFTGKLAPASEWRDYLDNDNYPMDTSSGSAGGHGTSVAGIVLQVAPNATILPIRALDNDGSGDVDDIVAAIDHAITMGADIINLSLGTDVDVAALKAMIDYAASQQVFVIASVGNEGNNAIEYPARYAKDPLAGNYLVSVGAVDDSDIKSSFSNYGVSAELFAPGNNIYTVTSSGGVTDATGTSFAAPMVTGAIALALGENPSPTTLQTLSTKLNTAAHDIEPGNPQYLGQVGFGRLDIEAFLGQLGYTAPAPARSALLVGNLPLSSSDQYIRDRLELLGFSVTTVDDNSSSTGQADGKDLVVISQTVTAANVNTKFRDVAVPVLTWEDLLFDDMKMSSSNRGDVGGHDSVSITTDHPLAAGFSGHTVVYQGAQRLAYGTPSAGAITVATVPGQPSKAVIFAYEAGAPMVGMEAPAKRVGFFFHDDTVAYDSRGATLFDAAVLWASYEGTAHPVTSKSYLEAVDYSALSGAFISGNAGGDTGSYMAVASGIGDNYGGNNTLGYLEYDLSVHTPDTYYVWLRVYGPDGGSDSFYAQMDAGARTAEHFGSQGQWKWIKVSGSFYLSGQHTLTLSHREDGARLDRILITSDASFTPSGLGGY